MSEPFHLFKRALLLVLADFLFFLQFVDGFLDVSPDIAHSGAVILQDFVQVLDDLLASFLSRRGHGHADDFPVVRGIEPQIRGANRFVNQRHDAGIPRRNDQ